MWILEGATPATNLQVTLENGTHLVGRSPEAAVHIQDASLSRKHAELRVVEDGVWVRDLDSQNGTRVEGKLIRTEVQVPLGARVECGDVRLTLRWNRGDLPNQFHDTPIGRPTYTVMPHTPPALDESPVAQQLATLLRMGKILAEPTGSVALEVRILELLGEILPIDRATLLLLEPDGSLEIAARRQISHTRGRTYSESIVRYVLQHGVAATFDDAQLDDRLGPAASLMTDNVRSAMCAPLTVDSEPLGVLYVDNLVAAHAFRPADLDLLAGFANQAALAMHNARLQVRLREVAVRQNTFERFFPKPTVDRLMESGGELGVEEFEVTALFSDISAYTALSSSLPPSEVVALLQAYFPPMAQIVFDRDGTLEKYIGDALLAVWGAPFAHEDDADRALEAAIEMQRATERMRQDLPHPIEIHVGLHSGVVALANIGSDAYLQIATIGDATNTSARVCGVADSREIVISEATRKRLKRDWMLTALTPTRVKGKDEALQLYRVEWRDQ